MEVSWGEANRAEGFLGCEEFGLPGTYTRIGSVCDRCNELERMRNVQKSTGALMELNITKRT